MKYFVFIIFLAISNLSHSYENNQLLLHNQPKKIDLIKLETLHGEKINIVKLLDNKKVILINFWATWCPPCIKEIPDLINLQQKNKKDVELVFISVDSNPKKAIPKFMKKNSFLKFESYVDNKLNLTRKLNVKIMPTTLIINNELSEISRVEGYIEWLGEGVFDEFRKLL